MTAPVLDRSRPAPAPPPRRRPEAAPAGPHLRVIPAPDPRRARDEAQVVRRAVALGAVLLALCVFGVVVFHVVLTQNQFRLDRLQEQSAQRQARFDRLRLQVAELESPDRVVADAQQRLGMVIPPKVTYLTPSDEEPRTGTNPPPGRSSAEAAAATPGTAWSTVKPHLAER